MVNTTLSGHEEEERVIFPNGCMKSGEIRNAAISVASPKKVIVRFDDRAVDFFQEHQNIENLTMVLNGKRISFNGNIKKRVDHQYEIVIQKISDQDRILYDKFLLSRLDKQFELSRKVEELALDEIQQLNKELSLSLKVEEAALAEAQRVNEELLEAQKNLITSRNQLKAILDGITEGIYLIDREFELLSLNKKQFELIGKTGKASPLGQKCYTLFFNRNEPCNFCPALHTFKTAKAERTSVKLVVHQQDRNIEFSSFPIFDENENVHQVVQYIQDVTERREMEEHLFQTEKMASLGTMTAGIAHELRNPLSSISMTIQLIKRKSSINEKIKKKINKIEKQVNKAGKILADIKSFSRKEKLDFTATELSTLVKQTMEQLDEIGKFKRIKVETNLNKTFKVMVEADQIDQVVINLITNAVDAMIKIPEPRLIVTTGNLDASNVFISVEDNGEGMNSEKIKKIFDPFFTTKPPGKGTGLGLALCYKIIERHRGTIKVSSDLNEGSKFTIIIPSVLKHKEGVNYA